MKLTDAQLFALRSRCIEAAARGYAIGEANKYLSVLAEETNMRSVPFGVKTGSAEHLRMLVQKAIDQRLKKEVKAEVKAEPKPKPKPKAIKSQPKPEKVAVAEAAEVKVTKAPPEAVNYDDWSQEALYKEAQARDLSGRSKMNRDELIDALQSDDLANEIFAELD